MVEHAATLDAEDVGRQQAETGARAELLTETEFQDLYRFHARPFWAYLFRLTGNTADADDLLQESFCRLLATPLATRDGPQMRAYLFRVATNAATDHWRRGGRSRRREEPLTDESAGAAPGREDAALKHDMARTFGDSQAAGAHAAWPLHTWKDRASRDCGARLESRQRAGAAVPRPPEAGRPAPQERLRPGVTAMTFRACSAQPDILTAAADGRELPAALSAHLASCPSCREQVDAVAFMRGLAAAPAAAHPLPDPAVISVGRLNSCAVGRPSVRPRPRSSACAGLSSPQDSPAWPPSWSGSGRAW